MNFSFTHQLVYFTVPLLLCAFAVGAMTGVLVRACKQCQICLPAINFSRMMEIAENNDWIKIDVGIHVLLKYWLPVLAWLSVIFIGSTSLLSAEQTSRFIVPFLRCLGPQVTIAAITAIHFTLRKLGHLTEYGILAGLSWCAFRGTLTSTRTLAIASLIFMVSSIFAASDEFHQSFVPSRTASPKDVMIDMCGALVGLMICWWYSGARCFNWRSIGIRPVRLNHTSAYRF